MILTLQLKSWATWRVGDAAPIDRKPLEMYVEQLRWSPSYGSAGSGLVLGSANGVRLVVDTQAENILQSSEDAVLEAQRGVPAQERSNRVALAFDIRAASANGKILVLATRMGLDVKQKCVL